MRKAGYLLFKRRMSLLHRTIVVNLISGNAIHGVCSFEASGALVVKGATVHEVDAQPAPADGEVLIDRSNVDFIQII